MPRSLRRNIMLLREKSLLSLKMSHVLVILIWCSHLCTRGGRAQPMTLRSSTMLFLDQKMNFLPPWMVRFLLFTPLTHIISNIYVLFTPTNTYLEFVSLYTWYFYLVDSGFPYTNGYLPPYRRERFNWQDFQASGDLRGFKELFNHRHLSLQMVIECCFGVLNFFFFHVLRSMPRYKFCRQPLIVNSCCTLHNFIHLVDRTDAFFVYLLLLWTLAMVVVTIIATTSQMNLLLPWPT